MDKKRPSLTSLLPLLLLGLLSVAVTVPAAAQQAPAAPAPGTGAAAQPAGGESERLFELGPGDSVAIQVYGQPDLSSTVNVSEDGGLPVGLVGSVSVAGLSPSQAAQRVEKALKDGNFLVNPHVSITVVQSRSQRVTVLGEVRAPGRFVIEANSTIFDLLAQAGGPTENSSDTVFLLRKDSEGNLTRAPIPLKGLTQGGQDPTHVTLKGGDSVFVPRAEIFSIYGEVRTPNSYRLEPGMTVMEALARAGGITERGSSSRIQITRHSEKDKNKYVTLHAALTDAVQPNDVIKVRQSIF